MAADAASRYFAMFKHWLGMLRGRSYWHTPQDVGQAFVPGELRGYFNDMTSKYRWLGKTLPGGIPLLTRNDGVHLVFPITVLQRALGCWDVWILSSGSNAEAKSLFIAHADWALAQQEDGGGIDTWSVLKAPFVSPYSAMTQGQAASVFVRAHLLTGNSRYLDAAAAAIKFMLNVSSPGAVAWIGAHGLVLEEALTIPRRTVLNGWIFAIFGLYDYCLAVEDDSVQKQLLGTVTALLQSLPAYEGNRWSYYDASGAIASPFYQRLHVAQLAALSQAFPGEAKRLDWHRQAMERQLSSRALTVLAMARKALQKLKAPPASLLR